MPNDSSVIRLTDVAHTILRRWRVVVATMVVAVLAGLAVSELLPVRYSATAVVTVSPITANPFGSTPINQQINMSTEQQVVRTTDVAERAAAIIGDVSADDVIGATSVTTPEDSQILQISYTSSEAARAAAGANAVAASYLESRVTSADTIADQLTSRLQERIDSLTAEFADTDDAVATAAIQQEIVALQQQQADLITVAINPGRVVGQATEPTGPSTLGLSAYVVAAGALGLLAGMTLALVREQTDRRVSRSDRLAEALTCPVITVGHDEDPREPYRLALLRLGINAGRESTLVVAVVTVGTADEAGVAKALADTAAEQGLTTRSVLAATLDTPTIDTGWPTEADRAVWRDVDVVVLDLAGVASFARQVAVSHRSDIVVLAADPQADVARVRGFEGFIADAGGRVDLAILTPDREAEVRHHADARRSASASEPRRSARPGTIPHPFDKGSTYFADTVELTLDLDSVAPEAPRHGSTRSGTRR